MDEIDDATKCFCITQEIDIIFEYYLKKLNINKKIYTGKIELPNKLVKDTIKRAKNMSGCFGTDYINHKIYTYLIEYAYDNNLECVDCYVDSDEIHN
jgi:hypothetical protein